MKKKTKFLFSLFMIILGMFIFLNQVDAFSYTVVNKGPVDKDLIVHKFEATIDGLIYPAYCLDPGKSDNGGRVDGSSYQHLNISKLPVGTAEYKFALGAQYIYTMLTNYNLTDRSGDGYMAGTTAFRMLGLQFIPKNPMLNANAQKAWNHYKNLLDNASDMLAWEDFGHKMGLDAIDFANQYGTTSYDQLVNNDNIFIGRGGISSSSVKDIIAGVIWNIMSVTSTPTTGSTYRLEFEIQPGGFGEVRAMDYSKATIELKNPTVSLIGGSRVHIKEATPTGAKVYVDMDASRWNGQDIDAILHVNYVNYKSAASQIIMLTPSNKDVQRFIVVRDRNRNHTGGDGDIPGNGDDVPIKMGDTCTCDTVNQRYTYKKMDDGKLIEEKSWNVGETPPAGIDTSKCPSTCEKKTCLTPETSSDGQWYDKSGNVTNEAGYYKDCECDQMDKTDSKYKQYCLKCFPGVTIPGDCNEIDAETKTRGTISDINIPKTSTTCNSDVNQVKYCVLGKNDAAGEEFLAPNEINNNPYCKVYCEEEYEFELPTAMFSNSGRYIGYKQGSLNDVFLQTKITGVRNCYTTSADDPMQPIGYNSNGENQFMKDYEAAQRAVIDAWNEYNHWKVAASIPATEDDSSCEHSPHSYSCNCSSDGDGHRSCDTCHCGGCSATGKVVTKDWSFVQYNYSGGSRMESDSYSDGEPAKCTHNTCTGKIGKNPDAEHRAKRDAARRVLVAAAEHLNRIISLYNSCTGVIGNTNYSSSLTPVDPSSTASSSWDNAMVFEPEVGFRYDEDYMKNEDYKFKRMDNDGNGTPSYMFCNGDITDEYTCQGHSEGSIISRNTTVVTCSESECGAKPIVLSDSKWIRKSRTHKATYQSDKVFSTSTPYGTVRKNLEGDKKLWSSLPSHSFPVELKTGTGVYNYSFQFSKIGQHNRTNQLGLGRLIGETNSVLNAFNKLDSSSTCRKDNFFTGSYVCHYIVNCPDCNFVCDDENNCELDCSDGHCIFDCPNCVFDGKTTNYTYRTISLNNLFPNEERAIGFNWDETSEMQHLKAQRTREEIDSLGEEIYSKPQYSFILTPNDMKNIRAYNDEAGSYVNNRTPESINGDDEAVYCETENINGVQYSVRCKSRFLDMLEQKRGYGTVLERVTSSRDGFVLYSCPNGNSCYGNGIGPAWKLYR